jgi:hypothetical protein
MQERYPFYLFSFVGVFKAASLGCVKVSSTAGMCLSGYEKMASAGPARNDGYTCVVQRYGNRAAILAVCNVRHVRQF